MWRRGMHSNGRCTAIGHAARLTLCPIVPYGYRPLHWSVTEVGPLCLVAPRLTGLPQQPGEEKKANKQAASKVAASPVVDAVGLAVVGAAAGAGGVVVAIESALSAYCIRPPCCFSRQSGDGVEGVVTCVLTD